MDIGTVRLLPCGYLLFAVRSATQVITCFTISHMTSLSGWINLHIGGKLSIHLPRTYELDTVFVALTVTARRYCSHVYLEESLCALCKYALIRSGHSWDRSRVAFRLPSFWKYLLGRYPSQTSHSG